MNQYTNITGGIATAPVHDLDGNLASFNGWTYVWNGENRLILASNVEYVVTFVYDHQSRCIEKTQHKGPQTRSLCFVWDDFNIISETLSTNNSSFIPHSSSFYIWGLDLSESLQGAGGVGGLLAEIQDGTPYFSAFDANGNEAEYISTNGTVEAHREYSAFGETLVLTGTKKDDFTHWWSTKPFDPVTGFSEYEYRKYLPPIGRWVIRDPIEERDGPGLYGFVGNEAVNGCDFMGKSKLPQPSNKRDQDEFLKKIIGTCMSQAGNTVSGAITAMVWQCVKDSLSPGGAISCFYKALGASGAANAACCIADAYKAQKLPSSFSKYEKCEVEKCGCILSGTLDAACNRSYTCCISRLDDDDLWN